MFDTTVFHFLTVKNAVLRKIWNDLIANILHFMHILNIIKTTQNYEIQKELTNKVLKLVLKF